MPGPLNLSNQLTFSSTMKRVGHPFTIHVSPDRFLRNRFTWSIRQRGRIVKEAWATYPTFEEARLTGKAALDEMIRTWRLEAPHRTAA